MQPAGDGVPPAVPPPGRRRRRLVLAGILAGAVAVLLVLAGIAARTVLPGLVHPAQHRTAPREPTYPTLVYQQFCGSMDASSLVATFGRPDPEGTGGKQASDGFSCQLLASGQHGVNEINVRVSYLDTPAKARAAISATYPQVAKAKGVSQLRHAPIGDAGFAFACADDPRSSGCHDANAAAAAFSSVDPDNFAFASAVTRNAWISVAAKDDDGPLSAATGQQAVGAVIAFLRTNLHLIQTSATSAPTFLAGHRDEVHALAFSPDGKTLASGDQSGAIRLWNVATGRTTATLVPPMTGTTIVESLAFSPDGRTLAAGYSEGTTLIWTVGTGQPTAHLASGLSLVESVAFSPDGKTLAVGGDIGILQGGAIQLWDVASVRITATLGQQITNSVAFSPDGRTLASGAGGSLQLWNVATRQATTLPGSGGGGYWSLAFSPDGRTLATGSDSADNVRLWNVATAQVIATFSDGTDGPFHSVAFSPDGKTVASPSNRNGIDLWNVSTGQRTTRPGNGPVAFSPHGGLLASTLRGNYVLLWKLGR